MPNVSSEILGNLENLVQDKGLGTRVKCLQMSYSLARSPLRLPWSTDIYIYNIYIIYIYIIYIYLFIYLFSLCDIHVWFIIYCSLRIHPWWTCHCQRPPRSAARKNMPLSTCRCQRADPSATTKETRRSAVRFQGNTDALIPWCGWFINDGNDG